MSKQQGTDAPEPPSGGSLKPSKKRGAFRLYMRSKPNGVNGNCRIDWFCWRSYATRVMAEKVIADRERKSTSYGRKESMWEYEIREKKDVKKDTVHGKRPPPENTAASGLTHLELLAKSRVKYEPPIWSEVLYALAVIAAMSVGAYFVVIGVQEHDGKAQIQGTKIVIQGSDYSTEWSCLCSTRCDTPDPSEGAVSCRPVRRGQVPQVLKPSLP